MAVNPLLALIGQASGANLPAPEVAEEILVTAAPRRSDPRRMPDAPNYSEPDPREQITPQYVLNDNRMQPAEGELDELLPRKGMFGTKGTLRDILGTLGDAFLLQSGNDRIYAPKRQMEREGDALFGFSQDPMQAIERLGVHNPAAAQELFQQYQQQQHREATLASQEAARRSQIENRDFDNREKGLDRLSRWVKGGLPYNRIVAAAENYGLSPEDLAELGVTPDMTADDRARFASGDMTVNQQTNVPFTERRVAVSERNADTAEYNAKSQRMNATRPRATPRPRADTELEYYRSLSEVPDSERTPEERAFMRRYIEGTRGRGSRIGNPPPPPPSGGNRSRFRIIE